MLNYTTKQGTNTQWKQQQTIKQQKQNHHLNKDIDLNFCDETKNRALYLTDSKS